NRDVFTWQIADSCENKLFIPYSQRNKGVVKNQISIRRTARKQIYRLLEKFNMTYYETDETGFNYTMSLSEIVFDEIKQFYIPKSYNDAKQYVETDSLENFVCFGSPLNVIDTIELFANNLKDNNFEIQINQILKLNELPLRLGNRRIISNLDSQVTLQTPEFIQEVGLKELLQEAVDFYETGKVKIGVEKLWDALERLKTYYSPTLDKKKSIEKIIEDMSKGKKEFKDMYELEFKQLTKIGNDFRIRHHETTKINIDSEVDYDYFYKRCMSLISTATQSLKYKI
ncbi:TPA: AbiJ-NTD4 domain-containing protein, partial [Listeria monocytogenes]